MKRQIFLYLFLLLFCCISCKKKTIETFPDKSKYDLNGTEVITPYSLFQINDVVNNPTSSNYTIAFYSKDVGYSVFGGQFVGSGNMISLNIDPSIFKTGTISQVFKIDNLQEGVIQIKDGNLYSQYNFSDSTGSEIKINSGVLTVWKFREKYKINYKIILEDNSTIEGSFWDGMSIVYK